MTLLTVVLAGWVCAAAPAAPSTFVSGRISRNLSGVVDVYEPFLRVNQWVHPWGGGASVSGFPLQGQVSGSAGYFHFFGSGVNANISEFGGHYRINATVSRGNRVEQLFFSLDARGPVNDPARPPSFTVWHAGTNLSLNPSAGGRDYSMSGWVDERFGAEGLALVGIVTAMALQQRPAASLAGPEAPLPQRIPLLLPPATLRF